MNKLYNGDFLIESSKIKSGTVDLILTDLPYGIMEPNHNGVAYKKMYKDKLKWDTAIEPSLVYEVANRILRKNGKMILFSQEPYTSRLISNSIPNLPYSFKMIWEKDSFGSHLKCNKAPLGYFEEMIAFSKLDCYEAKKMYQNYMQKYVEKYGKDYIIDLFLKEGRYTSETSARVHASYKFGFGNGNRIDFMDEKLYYYLSKHIEFDNDYNSVKSNFIDKYSSTFNLWNGQKFKSNILKYKKDNDGFHPTQKPILLLEDLIKTFSNENDLVVDLTMGSGSTGVACQNLNRKFVGIEMDKSYFDIAQKRIQDAKTLFSLHCA